MLRSVFQCKGEGSKGFAAAGGNRQSIKPLLVVSSMLLASFEHSIALLNNNGIIGAALICLCLCADFLKQDRNGFSSAAGLGYTVHKSFGINEVSVHKAGVEHSRVEHTGDIVLKHPSGWSRLSFRNFTIPWRGRLYVPFLPPQQGGGVGTVVAVSAVWNARVVPGNGKGSGNVPMRHRVLGTCGGMVCGRAAF